MSRYYTRACNFYYGDKSKKLIKEKKTLPLNGSDQISFDKVELFTRENKKIISINKINSLPSYLKKQVTNDIKLIIKENKFKGLNFRSIPIIMGVLNLTPDSFSDGGKYNKISASKKHLNHLFKSGADLVDIGGESTRPGSKSVSLKVEWSRIENILKNFDKKKNDIS